MTKDEDKVFAQNVCEEELHSVTRGTDPGEWCGSQMEHQPCGELFDANPDPKNCNVQFMRPIYGGNGFPNCAATVEDGSWCETNDACYTSAVKYQGLVDCAKAWH